MPIYCNDMSATTPDRQLWMCRRGPSGLRRAGSAGIDTERLDQLKKQVLVSVDRAETRIALLEASGTPAPDVRLNRAPRKRATAPEATMRIADSYTSARPRRRSISRTVVQGKVDDVRRLEAGVVDIGLEKNGFLHVDGSSCGGGGAQTGRRTSGRGVTTSSARPGIVVQIVEDLKHEGRAAVRSS